MFCREQTVQVHRKTPQFESLGARVVVIGNGTPRFIEDFRRTTEFDGELLVDPSREAYRACGFQRGVRSTFNRKSVRAALRTLSAGYRQGRTRGDPWQQGGALLVAPPREIVSFARSAHSGDHAPLAQMLEELADFESVGA